MNLYHVYVDKPGDEHPPAKAAVYAHTSHEAIAGALSLYDDAEIVSVSCYLKERDVAIIRGGINVLHADCFPA